MKNDFLIVHKSKLPEYLDQVIEARELIENNDISVSDACKETGISRSTFYKYKDYVFKTSEKNGRKAIISFKLPNKKGALSNVLNAIASNDGNILTINQETPIHGIAFVIISLDIIDLRCTIDELIAKLGALDSVMTVSLIAVE